MTAAEALQSTDPLTAAMAFQLKDKGLSWEEALEEIGADFKADTALAEALSELRSANETIVQLKAENQEYRAVLERYGWDGI